MKNKRHVQLPTKNSSDKIDARDQLVYVSIRRYMNKDTMEAFPSMQTICKHCGASEPTVRKCIKNLELAGYLKVIKKVGCSNRYLFNNLKKFEPFSYDFLDKEDLTLLEKSYILATQQYMYKHSENQTGITTLSNSELSNKTGISLTSINRCNKSLQQKHYLDIIKTNAKELDSGCKKNSKIFHLGELEQAIVFTLCDHENRINKNTQDIEILKTQMQNLLKQNEFLIKENRELKKEIIQDATIIID